MVKKKTKFCLSCPNKTLEISGRLRSIAILLIGRTIVLYSNLISPLSPPFNRMWRYFLLDDPNTKKVPGVAECSPPPLYQYKKILRNATLISIYSYCDLVNSTSISHWYTRNLLLYAFIQPFCALHNNHHLNPRPGQYSNIPNHTDHFARSITHV